MILDQLVRLGDYRDLHPGFARLADFLAAHDLTDAAPGRIDIDGPRCFINVDDSRMKKRKEQLLEVHRRYIDVHLPLSGEEICGWKPLAALSRLHTPYDAERDYAFYAEPAQTYFTVSPGQFYVCFPHDAHAPVIGRGMIRKLVAKLLLAD